LIDNDASELLIEARKWTYSAAVSDCCDAVGLRSQCVSARLGRISGSGPTIGWARTVEGSGVDAPPTEPYLEEIAFVDSLVSDDFIVGTADPTRCAVWGELFSIAALARGAVGAAFDGAVRDVNRTPAEFPVFAAATHPADTLARSTYAQVDQPIYFGGVRVASGDLIVADDDGMVVVPRQFAVEVLEASIEKAKKETTARDLLAQGVLLSVVWKSVGVL